MTKLFDSALPVASHSGGLRGSTGVGPIVLRLGLVAVMLLAGLVTGAVLARFALPPAGEPGLVTLLHFMAGLKGAITLIVALALVRRFARPLPAAAWMAYAAGGATMTAGVVWLWFQWHLGWGVLLYYVGAILIALTAARDARLLAIVR